VDQLIEHVPDECRHGEGDPEGGGDPLVILGEGVCSELDQLSGKLGVLVVGPQSYGGQPQTIPAIDIAPLRGEGLVAGRLRN